MTIDNPTGPAPPIPLVTGRYQDWIPEHGVPVRITVGHPRFFRHEYDQAMSLAPFELMRPPYKGIDNIEVEKEVYRRRLVLHRPAILDEINELARKYPGQTAVLLCYENVAAGEECHRRWAANWMAEEFGWDVPEIRPSGKAEPAPQPTLPFDT